MTKKFDEQQRVLVALNDVHAQRMTQRAQLRAEVERAYEAKLYNLKLEEAKLMIEGYDLGISKSKLGRAVGTSDWRTVNEMLEIGREMLPTPVEWVEPFQWTDRFTMPNGIPFWYLQIDGDDFFEAHDGIPEHAGYLYAEIKKGDRMWLGTKPNDEAQQWAQENEPE